jgi:hypothetical protein
MQTKTNNFAVTPATNLLRKQPLFAPKTTARPSPVSAKCVLVLVGTWLSLEGKCAGSSPFLSGEQQSNQGRGQNEKAKNMP